MSPDSVTVIGTTLQTVGVWALAALLVLVSRAIGLDYARLWARGWLWLAGALTALQFVFRLPRYGMAFQPLYHFGELVFLWYLDRGGRACLGGPTSGGASGVFFTLAGAFSLAVPFLAPSFTEAFVVQALLLSGGFAWVSLRLRGGDQAGGLGIRVTQAALVLLAADFGFHALALGVLDRHGIALPGAYSNFTSLYDLLFEMLLAFGLVVLALQDAARRIRTLTGLLPICAWCRKIRDDQGYWSEFEAWVKAQGDVDLTHGICPECRRKAFGDLPEEGLQDGPPSM